MNLTKRVAPPDWIVDILNSGLVYEIKKFSKYIHGAFMLMPHAVKTQPFWIDILRDQLNIPLVSVDPVEKLGGNRPKSKGQPAQMQENNNNKGEIELTEVKITTEATEPTPKPSIQILEQPVPKRKVVPSRFGPSVLFNRFTRVFNHKNVKNGEGGSAKRVQLPMRVEPKTFFANERTFLQWLSFLILIQTIGVGLSQFSGVYDSWKIGGLIIVAVSFIFMVYAYAVYCNRRRGIRDKRKVIVMFC